jgi:DNA repair protein RadC
MYLKFTPNIRVHDAETVAKIFYDVLKTEDEVDQQKEHLWAMGLTSRHRVLYLELISLGNLTESVVHPREVFKSAILKSVYNLILCHNHPGEEAIPSLDDKKVTERLQAAGEIMGIKILDHIILGEDNIYSFAIDSQKDRKLI